MTLAADLSYAITHLTMRRDKFTLAVGSGLLYFHKERFFIVTAWHNLTGRHSDTLEIMHKQGAVPNNMIVHMPCKVLEKDGFGYFRLPIKIIIEDENKTYFKIHRQGWPRIDVAVIEIYLEKKYQVEFHLSDNTVREYESFLFSKDDDGNVSTIPLLYDGIITKYKSDIENIEQLHSVGDDLFLLGFPDNITDRYITPIWKRATIANMIEHGWNGQPCFLVDAASRKGMSGCPAIYYSRSGDIPTNGFHSISMPIAILHGVYVGRLGDNLLESQIGVVWQKQVINQIIEDGVYAPLNAEIEATPSQIDALIDANWFDSFADDVLSDAPGLGYLMFNLLEKIGGRTNPVTLKRALVHRAKATKSEACN